MIHCDPATLNASQTVLFIRGHSATLDSSPSNKTVTNNGGVTVVDSSQPPGYKALSFNGSSQYLTPPDTADFAFPGDFTIDYWISPAGAGCGWANLSTTNKLYVPYFDSATSARVLVGGADVITGLAFSANVFQHFALVRQGTALKAYINGVLAGSATSSATLGASTVNGLGISGNRYVNGKLQCFRIAKGLARWTKNFIPPTKY